MSGPYQLLFNTTPALYAVFTLELTRHHTEAAFASSVAPTAGNLATFALTDDRGNARLSPRDAVKINTSARTGRILATIR